MHKLILAAFAILLLAGCSSVPAAGTGKIGGMVMSPSGGAYAHARVTLNPGNLVTTTDSSGQFHFGNLTAGSYTLHFEPISGSPFDSTVKLADGQVVDDMFMPSQ